MHFTTYVDKQIFIFSNTTGRINRKKKKKAANSYLPAAVSYELSISKNIIKWWQKYVQTEKELLPPSSLTKYIL